MRQYATFKPGHLSPEDFSHMKEVCEDLGVEGLEMFMDDICPREESLMKEVSDKQIWVEKLRTLCVKRLHCSYWAYPTSFLTKNCFAQLIDRFGSLDDVRNYYGDLTGCYMYGRWSQEYELAKEIGAQSYVFHLIDYAPIDGMWEFTISREDIRQAMVFMIQNLLNLLTDCGLITADSPLIEIENAGFGLEYGIQTAEDYQFLFKQLYDPLDKVRIGWDTNHLLHALGYDSETQRARFFLTEQEITPEMRSLEHEFGSDSALLAEKWLSYNILHPKTVSRTGSLQLSDCVMKRENYFVNGRLKEPYYHEITNLKTWGEKENYGVEIVLSKYDSHEILGEGCLNPKNVYGIIEQMNNAVPDAVLLHELKNSPDMRKAVRKQKEEIEKVTCQ